MVKLIAATNAALSTGKPEHAFENFAERRHWPPIAVVRQLERVPRRVPRNPSAKTSRNPFRHLANLMYRLFHTNEKVIREASEFIPGRNP